MLRDPPGAGVRWPYHHQRGFAVEALRPLTEGKDDMGKRFAILICVAAALAVAPPSQVGAANPTNTASASISSVGCGVQGFYAFRWQGKVSGGSLEISLVDQTSGTTVDTLTRTFPNGLHGVSGNLGVAALGLEGHTYVTQGRLLQKNGRVIVGSEASASLTLSGCS
jgi:hypothetical protein